jgi:hypothetical protein
VLQSIDARKRRRNACRLTYRTKRFDGENLFQHNKNNGNTCLLGKIISAGKAFATDYFWRENLCFVIIL